MKRLLAITAAILMIAACMTGCDWYLLTREQVVEGFAVTFGAFFTVAMTYSGDTAEYQYDALEDTLTFTGYDISNAEYEYTTISGTADGDGMGSFYAIDMQLAGGPVTSIQYTITNEDLFSILNLEPVAHLIRANDFDYVFKLTESDYQ